MSNIEKFLTAILNDEHLTAVDIISRMDKYLKACCTGEGCEGLPQPQTRADVLLYELAEKLSHGGGGAGYVDTKKLNRLSAFCQSGYNLDFIQDENFDSSNVENMDNMFKGCTQLVTAPALDTGKVSSMNYMFDGCTNLKNIPHIDGKSCWAFYGAFNGCTALESITFSAGTIQADIDFSPCINLNDASLLSILQGIKTTVGYVTLKLPANKEAVITGDETMNNLLTAIRAANWTVSFI